MSWLRKMTLVGVALLMGGCSTAFQKLDSKQFYKRDIEIEINEVKYEGVVTVPHAETYNFMLRPKGDLDLVIIRSCHRDHSPGSIPATGGGFLGFNKTATEFRYEFIPEKGLEDVSTGCPIRIEAIEAEKGRNSWAFIAREHPDYTLQATIQCNAADLEMNGVEACQARAGTTQRMLFEDDRIQFAPPKLIVWQGGYKTIPAPSGLCPMPIREDHGIYTLVPARGECIYTMRNQGDDRGRLYMIGYEGVLVREGK